MAYKKISPQVVVEGGSGLQSTTPFAPICGGTASTAAFQSSSTGISNSGYVLTSTGSSSLATWQAATPSVAGSYSFMAQMSSGSVTFPGSTGYSYGASVALTTIFDNTSGAFYAGNGSGTPASFTAPFTGMYVFSFGGNWTSLPAGAGILMICWASAGGALSFYSIYSNPSPINVSGLGFISTSTVAANAGAVITWLFNTTNSLTSATIAAGSMSYVTGYRIA